MLLMHPETPQEKLLHVLRMPFAFLLAVVVTIFLFYLMQSLIDHGEEAITDTHIGQIVDFTRVKEEREVQRKKRRPDPPPLPDEPPKVSKPVVRAEVTENAWSTEFRAPVADINVSNSLSFRSDGEYLPILKVQPNYPTKALERGLVGWVVVEFTVDEIGRVLDPVVVDHCVQTWRPSVEPCSDSPGRIFDRSALVAASKFKYKPKIIDGQAVATAGVRNMITFELDEEG